MRSRGRKRRTGWSHGRGTLVVVHAIEAFEDVRDRKHEAEIKQGTRRGGSDGRGGGSYQQALERGREAAFTAAAAWVARAGIAA